MRILTIVSVLLVFSVSSLSAQKESRHVNKGNELYGKEKYVESEVEYRKGLEKNNSSFSGNFNLGDALFRQEKYKEAGEQFEKAAVLAGDDKVRVAAAYHNLGNSLLKEGQIEPSIEAYKQALRNNPDDHDTRYNLAYAKRLLQQQQNQPQQQNNDQQEQKEQDQQQNSNQDQQKQQKQQDWQDQQGMSKENAQRILDALQQDEKDTQEKVKEQQAKQSKRYRVEKDW